MVFKKGQSGNPGGRARIVIADGKTLTEIAREHTATAIKTLVDIAGDGSAPHNARVQAARSLLERGFGRCLTFEQTEENTIDGKDKKERLVARSAIYHATGVPVSEIPDDIVEAKAVHLAVVRELRKVLEGEDFNV